MCSSPAGAPAGSWKRLFTEPGPGAASPWADGDSRSASEYADLVVVTGMGSARNNINILTGDAVVAVGMGAGTASEICLALKASRPVVLVMASAASRAFFQELAPGRVRFAADAREAMSAVDSILSSS